jgi:hypothetical protein
MEFGPLIDPAGGWVGDPLDEPADEGRFGLGEREPVFLLDQEEPGGSAGQRGVDQLADLGLLPGQVAEPAAQAIPIVRL